MIFDNTITFGELLTLCIAIFALIVAIVQINVQRFISAKQIYKEYLKIAMQNPKFSSLGCKNNIKAYENIKSTTEDYEAYEFYVSILLTASEEILELFYNNKKWEKTIITQLEYHYLYLSTDFKNTKELYSEALENLINFVIYNEQEKVVV